MAANTKGEPGNENRFRNCPISGGPDFSCFRPERLPELHSPSPARWHCRTVHGRPVRLALPVGDLRVSGRRSGTSAGQPLRAVGGGRAGAGDRQHSCFPRLDGPERASTSALRGGTVGRDLLRRATGLCRVVPVALAGTRLRRVLTMTSNRTILITGVTGNQGGAVAQALQGADFHLRGLTRKPDSEQAAALARNGIEIVKGDLDDEATLRRAL